MEDSSVLIIDKNENKVINNNNDQDVNNSGNNNKVHFISLTTVMIIGFIANVEYGIVMPSLLNYLESMNGNNNDLGWALAMFSFAQVCFLPLVGYWADKRTMKECFVACLVVGVIGNVVYAMAVNPIMVIMGRFIAGIGSSNMALTNSYIAAVSTKEQRTKFMGIINGINAFGLVAGPAFNLGINEVDFSFKIDKVHFIFDPLRTPGWFLAILLFLVLLSFIWFREPTIVSSESDNIINESTSLITPGGDKSINYSSINNIAAVVDNEKKSLLHKSTSHPTLYDRYSDITLNESNQGPQTNYYSLRYRLMGGGNGSSIEDQILEANAPISTTMITPQSSFSHYSNRNLSKYSINHNSKLLASVSQPAMFYKKKVEPPTFLTNLSKIMESSLLTCLVINFVQNFVFGTLETILTPITSEQYGFTTLKNSIVYSVVSLEIIVFIILTVIFTGRGFQDKHAILFGLIALGAGLTLMMFFFGLGLATDFVPLWKFILSVGITTIGIPTQNTSVYSLYSKLLNRIYGEDESQGFTSGIIMVMGSLARIFGPIFAGYCLSMVRRLPLFIVLLALWIFDIGIVALFWKKLTFKFDPNVKTQIVSH